MVAITAPTNVGLSRRMLQSCRFQMLVVLLLGVFLPAGVGVGWSASTALESDAVMISIAGATAAALGMIIIVRQIVRFPGAIVFPWILPSLATFYGIFMAGIAFFRLDYSNSILLLCFAGTLLTRFAIASVRNAQPQSPFYLVPGGRIAQMYELQDLNLVPLVEPLVPFDASGEIAFVADLDHQHPPEWERFIAETAISGHQVYHCKPFLETMSGRVQIDQLSENNFGAMVPSCVYLKIKRIVDFTLALIALPVLVVPFWLIAIAIKLDSPGPAFFRQTRMGYRGQPFTITKFRTMSCVPVNGDSTSALSHDSLRITRVGRWLRLTRFDELPQVFNIVRGEMSWIGPRPEEISLSLGYEAQVPFYRYRHIVRPGISGWAQVNQGHVIGGEQITTKLQLDFFYIKNVSYWLDVLILFKTIRTMVSGFGAR